MKKVINTRGEKLSTAPSASRARGVCHTLESYGVINNPVFVIPRACAPAREAKARKILNPAGYFRAWRIAKFGEDFDPIQVSVDEAVKAFCSNKTPANQNKNRLVWLKIANRVGYNLFLDALDEQIGKLNELSQCGKSLKNPAASFQKLLNKRFPKKGGAQ